uniref:Uncharacterized protein n=1 Tax=Cacopsylla melanoneura TaxID=428564 RepID=A0A8D9E3E1_9HEMI
MPHASIGGLGREAFSFKIYWEERRLKGPLSHFEKTTVRIFVPSTYNCKIFKTKIAPIARLTPKVFKTPLKMKEIDFLPKKKNGDFLLCKMHPATLVVCFARV